MEPDNLIRRTFFRCSLTLIAILSILAITTVRTNAYTVVQVSTASPSSLEQSFIAATTAQFSGTVFVNPFFPGTFQILLTGENSSYNPVVSNQDLLNEITQISTSTFIYGFADGMTYQQTTEEGSIGFLGNLCGSATSFSLIQTTAQTFDKNTCEDVVTTIESQLFAMSLSTPTPLPQEP